MGNGQILVKGTLITTWESATARSLAFLFANYPEGLRRERIIDLLWPEISAAKGNSLFHSSLHRVRTVLGKEIVIHENGVYRINPACTYSYDKEDFLRLAKSGLGDDDAARRARLSAIDLYRGPFLETCDAEWCNAIREELHNAMLNLVLAQAQYLAKEGAYREAEAHFVRAVGLDSYDERAHRGIMWCRSSNSDRTGALRQFRECSRILQDELGVRPGAETLALYQAILSGKTSLPSL
jgi:DNA-binding SARP family transcriptional activator